MNTTLPATLKTADGLKLLLREWPCADSRGTVLIVHGLGEHIGRYAHVAAHLNAWGWGVVGYDQRGHGASEGERGKLARDDDLLQDLALVIDAVRAAQDARPQPLVLLGHSMGGLVAARFVAGGTQPRPRDFPWYREVDALVLSSPALDLGMNAGQKLLLAVLGAFAPGLAVGNGLKPEWISRDPKVVQAYVADPLVHNRVSPRLVNFMVGGVAVVHQRAANWAMPTLLLYSGSDRCVAPAGSAAFAAAAPQAMVTTRVFAPLFHEIFNEPEQEEVFAALRDGLAGFAALSAATATP